MNEKKENLILLPEDELRVRLEAVKASMAREGMDAIVVCDNANMLYFTGRVVAGYIYIPRTGEPHWFVRRPVGLEDARLRYIRKPEEIPAMLLADGYPVAGAIGVESDILPWNLVERLRKVFVGSELTDSTNILREVRSVKTRFELSLIEQSGRKHVEVYHKIPGMYAPGMTDHELQIQIEYQSRLEGNLGVFRISGQSMEIFMGNVLSGENADVPAPYDFAMGGRGLDPSIPGGASGEEILNHTAVMADVNGNFTGYMTDMTRVFSVGSVSDKAMEAHRCSIDICRMFEREALPGVEAKALYAKAVEIVAERCLSEYFMGHRQHAGFIGHGVGIEVNEWPVVAPHSRHILVEGNVIALEPKFVIPRVGAVGIENTYVITPQGARCVTNAPEDIISLV